MNTEIDFDADGLTARVAKASVEILKRMGAYVRRVAQSKVKTSPKASQPGTPPHSKCAGKTAAVFRGGFGGELRPQGEPRRGAQAAARGLLVRLNPNLLFSFQRVGRGLRSAPPLFSLSAFPPNRKAHQ